MCESNAPSTAKLPIAGLKICSPTSLLCGLNNLPSPYAALFGLNHATRHTTMQPNMQPRNGSNGQGFEAERASHRGGNTHAV